MLREEKEVYVKILVFFKLFKMASSKNTVCESTFKGWVFSSDFTCTIKDGIVIAAKCKYCSQTSYDKLFCEAKNRNMKGQVLKSIMSYRNEITYIHHKSFARHVGDINSIHNWCKKAICPQTSASSTVAETTTDQSAAARSSRVPLRVDTMFIGNSTDYYKKLFKTALYIAEEELAFLKFKSLVLLQVDNGVKLGSTDKLNHMTCAEMVDILAEVIREMVGAAINSGHFISLSADASEAQKTSEEKELVYGKVVVNGDIKTLPCTFLLKCQSLKEFGGGDGEGTFKAMINAAEIYTEHEKLLKKVVCLTTDGAAVNFGKNQGALARMQNLLEWDVCKFHCFNHKLELGMKDAYVNEKAFEDIRSALTTLYYLFKNSGKSWRLFRIVGEQLSIHVLRYSEVHGTRCQAHT